MAEAMRASNTDPFNSAIEVGNKSTSIALRMKQNKEAMSTHYSQQNHHESPLQFQPHVESQRVQMINNMKNRQVGHGLQSASSHQSREVNQLRDSRQKERSI